MSSGKNRAFLRIITGLLAFLLLLFLAGAPGRKPGVYVQTWRSASRRAVFTGRSPATTPAPGQTLNLNTASQEELERLEGIGTKTARAILTDREQHGPFRSVEDLTRVRGIGKGRLEKLRPYLTVEEQK